MNNINSGYLPSTDMFIWFIINKHRITQTPNMQHYKTSNEYIPET